MQTFAEFWPHYVRAHSKLRTRILHAIGSTLALAFVILGIAASPWFFLGAPLIGYSFAWYGHFFVEHNKPATFGHPFWSLAADYVMLWKMLTGQMSREVAKHAS
jgi:hypothetical protein